jgi:hypothetical protein
MHTHFLPVLIFRVLRRRILRLGLRQLSLEVAQFALIITVSTTIV